MTAHPRQNRKSSAGIAGCRLRTLWLAAVCLALACRALYLREYAGLPLGSVITGADVLEYDRWARDILLRGILWDRVPIHGPLYPLLLAFFYRLTGFALPLVRGLQLLLDVVSLMLVTGGLALLGCRRAAVWTAFLWALYQPLMYYSAELYSEVLVVFCLSAAFFCWALASGRWLRRLDLRVSAWLTAALFCGLAAIAHPLSLGISCAFLGAGFWVTFCRVLRPRLLLATAFGGLLMLSLPIVPVVWRNAVVSGAAVPVQGNAGLNLYIGNNPEATGTCYVRPGPDYDRLMNWPAREGVGASGAATRFFVKKVIAFIATHPLRALALIGRKMLLTWNAVDLTSGADLPQLQLQTRFMRFPLLRFGLVAPLAWAGWWLRRRKSLLRPLAAVPVATTLILGILVTSGRYRLAMMPMVLALAGIGADALWLAWRGRSRRLLLGGAAAAALGFLVAFVPVPPALPGSEVESALILGEAAWKQKQYREAERLLARVLSRHRRDPALYHLAGNVLADEGRLAEAAEALKLSLSLAPKRVKARVDLAIVYSEQGKLGAARRELNRALDTDPENADAWYNLGVLDEREGKLAAALSCYRKAAGLDPLLTSAMLNAAILEHRLGQPEKAVPLYRALLRLAPGSARAWAGLALALAELGRTGEAEAAFARSLALEPNQPRIRTVYAEFLDSLGKHAAAAALRQRAAAPTRPEKHAPAAGEAPRNRKKTRNRP